LSRDPAISVVGQAADPLQAREAIKALNPDVMTLDVEMPRMNGLEFLDKVMRLRPFPVIMISSLTERGAAITINAMEMGAIDCIAKPTLEHPDSFAELAGKVKSAATARVGNRVADHKPARIDRPVGGTPNGSLVAIGASTGGVEALLAILSQYPANCSPTVVTLHLPAPFTRTFVERLNRICAPKVVEAAHGMPILPGNIYVAPGVSTASKRPDQWPSAVGRRAVSLGREDYGRQIGRGHTDGHGQRRRQGIVGAAPGWRANVRSRRVHKRSIRDA
jgi:two-component system chemotaxis response regulator CheB